MSALWPNGQNYPGDVWHEFGPRAPIWTPNGPTSSFHSGIDIGPWGDKGGTWLLSPVNGEVVHAGYDDIFGNRVVVRGGGADFWLCHGRAGSIQVNVGQSVAQKQRLMLMGETGKASGVHVHFEVHVNGVRVDPRDFYSRPAGGGIEDDMTPEQANQLAAVYAALFGPANLGVEKTTWKKPFGEPGGSAFYGMFDVAIHTQGLVAKNAGELAAVKAAVSQLSAGSGVALDMKAIEQAAERGAKEALSGLTLTADVD